MSTNNPSLVVQRLDRATDIASSVGPVKCLVFPATGGVQAIDAAGAVLNLVGATGALAATVTDAVNNAASTALSLVHALSAGVGANGIGVTQRFVLPNSLGVIPTFFLNRVLKDALLLNPTSYMRSSIFFSAHRGSASMRLDSSTR